MIFQILKKLLKFILILTSIVLIGLLTFTAYNYDSVMWIDSTINDISSRNDYIEIVKLKKNFIEIPNKQCNTYTINTLTNNSLFKQPFEKEKYVRDRQEYLLNDRPRIDQLCTSFKDINMGVPASYLIEKLNEDNALYIISSIILEISNNVKNKVDEIHLYVKGYADNSSEEWEGKLLQEYMYENISYYPSLDNKNKLYKINEDNIKSHFFSKNIYTNNDLPLLRSRYVHDEYLSILEKCSEKITRIGILQGEVVNHKSEELRNTQIFITACYPKKIFPSCSRTDD